MTIEETIKDIRKRCRLAMDGIVSSTMRQYGLEYKLNFGVSLQKIKDIARNYQPDKELAETLWNENVRELKIMATLLYPIDEFSTETSNRWVRQIPNQEIREQICFNLFQGLPYASEIAIDWSNNEDSKVRATGYWLLSRLLIMKKFTVYIRIEDFNHVISDVKSEDLSLRKASLLLLKQIGRLSVVQAKNILEGIRHFKNSPDMFDREIFDSLSFEFEYYSKN